MRKYLILTLIIFTGLKNISSYAQMSDDAVINYVKGGFASGRSEKEMGKELLARGVTEQQAERIKARLEGQTEDKAAGDKTIGDISRERRLDASNAVGQETVTSSVAIANEKSRIYGHDIFHGGAMTFEPNENLATPENYVLGPGDQVIIDIWGFSEASISETISPEGKINISQVGPIYLSGLTIKEASNIVKKSLAVKYSSLSDYSSDNVSVTLGKIRTIQVNIMGEVATPGTYRLSSFSTVFHALYRAGGVKESGTLRAIKVVRGGKVLPLIDIYEYLLSGKSDTDIRLMEGDVIMVSPSLQLVQITNGVKRPLTYEMKNGETLENLVMYAGGYSYDAYVEDLRIIRKKGVRQQVLTISDVDVGSTILEDGDVVSFGTNSDKYDNRLEIRGHILQPGLYELGNEIKTIRQLVERAGGLEEDAYLDRAIIEREKEDLSLEIVSFDIGKVLNGENADIPLKKNDIVVISGIHELFDRGSLSINGFVARPGQYPFADNTTIEDLIFQAGGLLDGASMARVDVARRLINPNSTMPSDTIGATYSFALANGLAKGDAKEFLLRPYDVVSVRRSPGYYPQRYVSIEGQVAFPGDYVLINEGERVSDIINRAGGPTKQAYLVGGTVVRKIVAEEKLLNSALNRMVRRNSGKDSLSTEKLDMRNIYTLGINLQNAYDNPGSDDDVILNSGDRILVPEFLPTVRVQGEVMYPNVVLHSEGKPLKYYIDAAGGYSSESKRKKAYIIYMNGNVSRANTKVKVEPGCEIIIPTKNKKDKITTSEWLAIATSSASIATTIATIGNLLKK